MTVTIRRTRRQAVAGAVTAFAVILGAFVGAPAANAATTPDVPPVAAEQQLALGPVAPVSVSLTVEDVEQALDIIQSQTTGVDGRFDFDKLVAAGVPEQIAIEYAGVLEAAGEVYAAPASQQLAIDKAAANFTASVAAVKQSDVVTASSGFDWGKVLRVAGSYVECLTFRYTLLFWYPAAACVPNPDGNGTWLVIYY